MNTRLLQNFGRVALATVLALSFAQSATAQSKDREGSAPQLVGTWSVKVQIVDCSNGNLLGPPFASLLSFARGGTLTEATSNPNFFPAERSPGHGTWSTGKTASHAATVAFVTLNGALQSTQVIRQNIQMGSSNDFSSTATVQFFDPNGNLLKSGCATAAGQRFK